MTDDPYDGYWCVVCQKFIEADDDGILIHDDIDHPYFMFYYEETLQ